MDIQTTTQSVQQAAAPAVAHTKSKVTHFFAQQNIGTVEIIQTASFFGVGFLAGMVLKKSLKYIVFLLVTVTIILALGAHFSFLHFDMQAIKIALGMQNVTSLDVFFSMLVTEIKKYWLESTGFILGFLIGCKAG